MSGTTAAPTTREPLACVVFDLDGLLVDSEPTHARANAETFAALGITMEPALQEAMLGRRVRDLTGAVAASSGWDPDDLFERREATFWRLVEQGTLHPMPGARETVERLHAAGRGGRLRLAVASSGHRRYVEHALETLGVRHAFELLVTGEDVTRSKPHPEIYEKVAAALGVPPASCLALEDAPHGVRSAATAGLRVLAIPAGPTLNGDFAQAEAVVKDLRSAGDYLLEVLTG